MPLMNWQIYKSLAKAIMAFVFCILTGCVYPGISLNKGRLLDPAMDPAKTSIMAGSLCSLPYKIYEQASISGGGSSGGSCPTCR